jgi:glycosyltransferase involved in cell wall biosynthesis
MIRKLYLRFKTRVFKPRISYTFNSASNTNTKKALLSYILAPYAYKSKSECPPTHANYLAAWEIIEILTEKGYQVTAIEASNKQYVLDTQYDLLIGTLDCIDRFASFLPATCTKIFYALGAYVDARNGPMGELKRVNDLEFRTGKHYIPKRLFPSPESIKRSVQKCDHLIITGGNSTIASFPDEFKSKSSICTMPIYPNSLGSFNVEHSQENNEFLWFFGYGQVHKGLDLVIEAFLKQPNLVLNIAGTMEPDFENIYGTLIKESPNIKHHGYLQTNSTKFETIVSRCRAFIAPTVNEGISCACVSLIQLGLYPIMAEASGVDLDKYNYTMLETCTVDEILEAVQHVEKMTIETINAKINLNKELALKLYSPEKFKTDFINSLDTALN